MTKYAIVKMLFDYLAVSFTFYSDCMLDEMQIRIRNVFIAIHKNK